MDKFVTIIRYIVKYSPVIITIIKELEDIYEESQKTGEA